MDKHSDEQLKKIYHTINTDDFNTMRGMLSDIEQKLLQLDPLHQRAFYQGFQNMILEAWLDACNPEDVFLYKQPWSND